MEHGPSGGNLDDVKPTRTIAAGVDPVALDAWAFTLFPNQPVPGNLRIAEGMGLGHVNFAALSPEEIIAG
jgi:hypothetical protein